LLRPLRAVVVVSIRTGKRGKVSDFLIVVDRTVTVTLDCSSR